MYAQLFSSIRHIERSRTVLIAVLIYFRLIAQIVSNYDDITDNFDNMNLKSDLLRGLPCALTVYSYQC